MFDYTIAAKAKTRETMPAMIKRAIPDQARPGTSQTLMAYNPSVSCAVICSQSWEKRTSQTEIVSVWLRIYGLRIFEVTVFSSGLYVRL